MRVLRLGGICADFSCALCCKDTEMLLSLQDVKRITALGFKSEEFCFIDQEGFSRLKNIDGSCFFLKENKCTIYSDRPQGCRFYPIIFDPERGRAIVDSECPLAATIPEKLVARFDKSLRKFIQRIMNEKAGESTKKD